MIIYIPIHRGDRMKKEFSYKGISLQEYCNKNNVNYKYVINRKCVIKKKMGLTDQEAINYIIDNYKDSYCYYKGIPLKEYCDINNINHSYIQKEIYNIIKNKNIDKDAAITLLIEKYKTNFVYYNGIHVVEYCRMTGINYDSLAPYVSRLIKKIKLTKEEAYAIAIEQYNKKFVMYDNKTMSRFCKDHCYNYNTIMSLRYKYIKRNKLSTEDATIKAVETYVRFINRIEKTRELLILRENSNNEGYLLNYCKSKGHNLDDIENIKAIGYGMVKSILLLEHINKDKTGTFSKLEIIKEVKEIEEDVQNFITYKKEINLTQVISYYNIGYNNLLLVIMNSLMPIINNAIYKNFYYDREEKQDYIKMLVIECLQKNVFFSEQQLRSYMYRYVKGELVKYYYSNTPTLSYNNKTHINSESEYINILNSDSNVEEESIG